MNTKQLSKLIPVLIIIPLYYIFGNTSIFNYVLSLSLYNIFISCFSHISFKDTFTKMNIVTSKNKILNLSLLAINVISLVFLLLGIIVSDITSSVLDLPDTFIIFLMMGLSISSTPSLKIIIEYLESTKRKKLITLLNQIYTYFTQGLLLLISILFFRIIKIDKDIAISLLYLPNIIITILVFVILYFLNKKDCPNKVLDNNKTYYQEIKKVLTKNHSKSIINIVKNSYYYISIIILYLILTTRYKYKVEVIEEDITFIYFYFLTLINYIISSLKVVINSSLKELDVRSKLYKTLKTALPIAIILSVISPLTCKLIFQAPDKSLYLAMLNFLLIFITMYDTTFEYNINKTVSTISLLSGLIVKIIITIPLINAFYRMGYNLVYGDILSTAISLTITIIINYTYLLSKLGLKKKKGYFNQLLNTLYENIILCIILIIAEFIVPIKTDNYIKSLFLMILYILISYLFFYVKNRYFKEKE